MYNWSHTGYIILSNLDLNVFTNKKSKEDDDKINKIQTYLSFHIFGAMYNIVRYVA